MYEYAELLILADHACATPRAVRLEVYEPVRMQWQSLTVFDCCSQVFSEPSPIAESPLWRPLPVRAAA